MERYVLTMTCLDRPGIVRALGASIVRAQGNITDSQQFSDPETGTFVVRTEFESPESLDVVRESVLDGTAPFAPLVNMRPAAVRRRALIMVSKYDHCLVDLLYRWKCGEMPVDIPVVVSNHEDLRGIVEDAGLKFVCIPVTMDTKREAEAELVNLVEDNDIDFVVLARYMQVLSDDLCRVLAGRAINIHHSFLPGFKGANPYHQAYARGVKLIGATAHYVTADLDEGPIIEQAVHRIGHSHTAEKLVEIGRDTERSVLSRAVRMHAEDRVVLVGVRTVVFD